MPEVGLYEYVDLGLIYLIYQFFEDEKRLDAEMTLTSRFCPMGRASPTM